MHSKVECFGDITTSAWSVQALAGDVELIVDWRKGFMNSYPA
jgi:hypothetical protein